MYRYILRESCSQFDSLPLTSLTSGVSPSVVACFPMLPLFRDIVFNFKALTVPSGAALPPIRRWLPEDAQLHWSVAPATAKAPARLLVYGFGTPLDVACVGDAAARDATNAATAAKPTSIFARLFGGGGRSRSTPSAADPSNLAGEFVATEEDVLHVKVRLSSFCWWLCSFVADIYFCLPLFFCLLYILV